MTHCAGRAPVARLAETGRRSSIDAATRTATRCRVVDAGLRGLGPSHRQSRGLATGLRARWAVAVGAQQSLPSHKAHGPSWLGGAWVVLRGRPGAFRMNPPLRAVLLWS